ncbi:MAG: hypothetical protein J7482_16945 [Roseiflexus sp.]|nr:hypothetical protein [Roseiflexus sp.]MBO9390425.1 hypothetical protein [Roseiflexus sp.]
MRRSSSWVRAPPARMQASEPPALRPGVAVALRLGARASCPRSRNAGRTPARRSSSWVRASGAHASEDTPPARRLAGTPALRPGVAVALRLGARASGAHASEDAPPART